MPTAQNRFNVFSLDGILEEIAAFCGFQDTLEKYISVATDSGEGEIEGADSGWISDSGLLRKIQEEIAAFDTLAVEIDIPSFTAVGSITRMLKKIELDGSPFPKNSLLHLLAFLVMIRQFRKLVSLEELSSSVLLPYFESLEYSSDLYKKLSHIIDDEGEIKDKASSELSIIRKDLIKAYRNLQKEADRVIKKYGKYIQGDQHSIRNGRIVIPVVDSHFRKVAGIVHGRSSSGITIFVEPTELVDANNSIDELENREKAEIFKILVEFADRVREHVFSLKQNWETLCYLDAVSAKRKWMVRYGGSIAYFTDDPHLKLVNAKHPVLVQRIGSENVVPLSLELGASQRLILVSGPNAGGKTVLLKTAAINIILAHLGFPVLCAPESRFPVLKNLLFDIGDRQSMEDDLSTFSAHLLALKNIIQESDANTLVLIDEMGTGTDPAEGAALSEAILNALLAKKSFGIVNSHHGALKVFAHEKEGIINGSMEFDEKKLSPTYRFRSNLPGSSYALEIARRQDFPGFVIDDAREIMGEERQKAENLILSLQKRLTQTEETIAAMEIEKNKYSMMEKKYRDQQAEFQKKKLELEKKAADEARQIIDDANAIIEKSVKEIVESKADKAVVKNVRKNVADFKSRITAREEKKSSGSTKTRTEHDFSTGDIVRWTRMDQKGEVLSLLHDEKMMLRVGQMKVQVPVAECELVHRGKSEDQKKISGSVPAMSNVGMELDLRGQYADEAEYALESYLSDARAGGWHEVRIIHGKGTGVLKKMVTLHLKRSPFVQSYRGGLPGEGGAGVTTAKLK